MCAAKANWQETGLQFLTDLVKKSKSSKAAIFVFSSSGDLIWQAGKTKAIDTTSLGALASGARGIASELNQITKCKTNSLVFGEKKQGYWIDFFSDWMLLGVGIEPNKGVYEKLKKHLKKKPKTGSGSNSEAFDGLSSAAIETAVKV